MKLPVSPRRPPIWVLALLVSVASPAGAESYICVADKSTGFKYEGKTWKSVDFNVSEDKFVLAKTEGKGWVWKGLGEETGITCEADFNKFGFMHCNFMRQVLMNRESLRFQIVYPIGYVLAPGVNDSNSDTPFITIGRCSKI